MKINISITAGVATYYSNGEDDYQKLVLYSNIARKKAKQRHKKFLIFNNNMRINKNYENNMRWIKEIKRAIAEGLGIWTATINLIISLIRTGSGIG